LDYVKVLLLLDKFSCSTHDNTQVLGGPLFERRRDCSKGMYR